MSQLCGSLKSNHSICSCLIETFDGSQSIVMNQIYSPIHFILIAQHFLSCTKLSILECWNESTNKRLYRLHDANSAMPKWFSVVHISDSTAINKMYYPHAWIINTQHLICLIQPFNARHYPKCDRLKLLALKVAEYPK